VGDLLEALQLEQTLSTSMSDAWYLRRAQLNFDDRDVRDNTIGRHGGINFDDLKAFFLILITNAFRPSVATTLCPS
jgi:hypothetical protein